MVGSEGMRREFGDGGRGLGREVDDDAGRQLEGGGCGRRLTDGIMKEATAR